MRELEESARIQSLQPRVMKSFSETRKADKSLVTGGKGVAFSKEATPPGEDSESATANGGTSLAKTSPRNLEKLKKLGTRERGGGKAEKKPAGKK